MISAVDTHGSHLRLGIMPVMRFTWTNRTLDCPLIFHSGMWELLASFIVGRLHQGSLRNFIPPAMDLMPTCVPGLRLIRR